MPFDGDVRKFEAPAVLPEVVSFAAPIQDDPVLRVLVPARELVARPGGWGQGALYRSTYNDHHAYCAAGAMMTVLGVPMHRLSFGVRYTIPEYRDAESALMQAAGYHGENIAGWNDAGHRTQKQVVDAFDRAIHRRISEIQPAPERVSALARLAQLFR